MIMVHWPSSGSTIKNMFFVLSYSRVENFQQVNSGSCGLRSSVRNGSGDYTKQWHGKSKSRSRDDRK